MMKYLKQISLKGKLFFIYAVPISLLLITGSLVSYSLIEKVVLEKTENELANSSRMLYNMVKTSIDISIKNHLRALAEKNRDIVAYYHSLAVKGIYSHRQAKAMAGNVLLSQKIGKTGYIFVWDVSQAPARIPLAVHPLVQGRDVSSFDFVQSAVIKKAGYMEYSWKNPGDKQKRPKAMYLSYFKEWQWVIAVSSYREEFVNLVRVEDFKDKVLSIKFGKTGYYFILDEKGNTIIHPEITGNILQFKDITGKSIAREIIKRKNGKLTYFWKNPSDDKPRNKLVIFNYIPELKWIVASSGYVDEFYRPLKIIRIMFLIALPLILLFLAGITFLSGAYLIRPMKELIEKFKEGSRGNYTLKMDTISGDEIGEMSGYFNIFMETLNKKSNELISAENFVRNIIDSLPSMLITVTKDGTVTQWNRATSDFTGIITDNAVSGNVFTLLPFLSNYKNQLKETIESKKFTEHLREPVNIDDKKRFFNISIIPFIKADVESAVIRLDEVTELVKNEEQLVQAQKMETVGNLAGGLAHDFNNVLEGVVGTVSLMRRMMKKKFDPQKMSRYVDIIDISAGRAADMVAQLLALSRRYETTFVTVDLNLSLKHVVTICRNTFDKSIELRPAYFESEAYAEASPVQIEQAILNLCLNASHAMTIMRGKDTPPGGILSLSIKKITADSFFCTSHPDARRDKEYWKISISDTGVGMNGEVVDRIFDPFFTTKNKDHGTGLGLSMVYNIIQQHHGFITVYSEPGAGSVFNVFLPAAEEAEIDDEAASMNEMIPRGEGLILVVDDEIIVREIARAILEESGYSVIMAENGEEGVELFREKFPEISLVILDMSMPRMSGKEAFMEMKKIDPECTVLLASGFKEDPRVQDTIRLGVNDFVQKPFSMVEMTQKVYRLIYGDE